MSQSNAILAETTALYATFDAEDAKSTLDANQVTDEQVIAACKDNGALIEASLLVGSITTAVVICGNMLSQIGPAVNGVVYALF